MKSLKNIESVLHSMYNNSNYLNIRYRFCYKGFKFFFNRYNILCINCTFEHLCRSWPVIYFSSLNASLMMAKKGRNMSEVYHTLSGMMRNYSSVMCLCMLGKPHPAIHQTAYMDARKKYHKTACTLLPENELLDVRNMSKTL